MGKTAFGVLSLTLLLVLVPSVLSANIQNDVDIESSGGSSNVDVKIDNKVNTGSQKTTTTTQTSKTNIDIEQSGEGHSEVTINGKKYSVDGPGSLHVTNSATPSPSPTAAPSSSPTSSQSDDGSASISAEITKQLEEVKSLLQKIFSLLENLF